jgi:drug/metabolite transporter (DMT)-like permease
MSTPSLLAHGKFSGRAAGLGLAALGAIAFSGKAIIVKLAYRHGVDAVTLIMLRMLFALPFFVAMAWWAGRGQARLSRRDQLSVVFLGVVGYYLSSFLDFLGLQYISASLERLILYLNPTMVLILGLLFFKRRITGWQILGLSLSYCGVVMVFAHEIQLQGQHAVLGAALVFASVLSYAVYLVYSGELVQRLGSLRLVGLATSVACLCCVVQFIVLRPLSAAVVVPEVLGLSLINALVCTVAPVLMIMMAMERLGPALVSQVGMIGPLSTMMMGALLLGEPLTPWVLGGTVLVLSGIDVFTRSRASPLPD